MHFQFDNFSRLLSLNQILKIRKHIYFVYAQICYFDITCMQLGI